jgi:hypothetical protein
MSTCELPISIEFLKEVYLFGVNLTDDKGNPYPDTLFEHYIRAAWDWAERHLGVSLRPETIVGETHDYFIKDYIHWAWLDLTVVPIESVSEVRFEYPVSESQFVFPSDWITFNPRKETASARIQILPRTGALSEILITRAGNLLPILEGANNYVPDVFAVDYQAGFRSDEIPNDVKHLIGMQAAIGPLNIAGDLLVGAGIASKTVSMPGLSQTVNTTSSATNSGYGSRILEYQKEIKDLLPQIKAMFGRQSRLVVI